MKRLFANLMVACMLCFACVALAQENAAQEGTAPARGVVATTEEQLAALNAMDDFQLASQIDSLTGSQVAQQIMVLNDGNHAILLARVLVTVKALIPTWGENKQTEVAQIINNDTTNIKISNETRPDVQIEVSTVNGKILVGDRNVTPPTAAAITAAAEQKVQQEAAAAQAAQAAAAGQTAGEGQAAGEGGQAAGEGGQAAGEGGQAAGEGQAAGGEGQAAAGEGQAAAGEGQAAAGEGQAAGGEGQAAGGDAGASVAGAGAGTTAGTAAGGINVRNSPMTNPVSTAGNNPAAPANPTQSNPTTTDTISPYASENTSTNSESPFQLQQ